MAIVGAVIDCIHVVHKSRTCELAVTVLSCTRVLPCICGKSQWNPDQWISWVCFRLVVCTGSRVPVLPVRTSGRRVQNSARKPEVTDDIMYSAHVQIHVILHMSTQCVRERVHCGATMETLPNQVPVLPVENYPNPIPEENATRLSPTFSTRERHFWLTCTLCRVCRCKVNQNRRQHK